MIYKNLGKSNLKVSAIGFGCWQLGGELNLAGTPQSYGQINEAEARKAISLALKRGINFFDTADFYGLGKSESILGEELKSSREEVIICTKGGCIPDGVKGSATDGSYEHLIAACNRSLKRLGTDYIDVYLLHFIPPENEREEALAALKYLKKQGKIKEYGISIAHNLDMIPKLAEDFPIIEGYYNLLLRRFEDFKKLINEKGTGFIAASPLSRGLLSGKNYQRAIFKEGDVRRKWQEGEPQHEWYIQQQNEVGKLRRLSEEFNIPLKNIAIAYILSNEVPVTIPGIKSPEQVEELLQSLEFLPLDKEIIRRIRG
jgi:aryl-alcohol dehydrogenase-like predicted oxidoreductase